MPRLDYRVVSPAGACGGRCRGTAPAPAACPRHASATSYGRAASEVGPCATEGANTPRPQPGAGPGSVSLVPAGLAQPRPHRFGVDRDEHPGAGGPPPAGLDDIPACSPRAIRRRPKGDGHAHAPLLVVRHTRHCRLTGGTTGPSRPGRLLHRTAGDRQQKGGLKRWEFRRSWGQRFHSSEGANPKAHHATFARPAAGSGSRWRARRSEAAVACPTAMKWRGLVPVSRRPVGANLESNG